MTEAGRPAVHPGAGVIGETDVVDAFRKGRRVLHVRQGTLVTHQARDAADRLGMSIVVGAPPVPAVPVTDGPTVTRRILYKSSPRFMASGPLRGRDPHRFAKLVIVGSGGVGATTAHLAANSSMAAEIVLIDVVPGSAAATALDLDHAAGISGSVSRVSGGTDLALVSGADVIVITAGRPRTPGMSRADLVGTNGRVVRQVAERIAELAPEAVVIVVTNPLDEMTYEVLRTTQFPRRRVLGMAGTLDSARFRVSLARAAGVDPTEVEAFTLGSHGEEMVPVTSRATVRGAPIDRHLSPAQIAACVTETIGGGAAVVALRRTGSATIAPAHAVIEVLDAMRGARPGAVPVSVRLEGEYGIGDVVIGVPCLLGPQGVEEVVELDLSGSERDRLVEAAAAVKARVASI